MHKTTVERDAFGIARFISDYKTGEQRRQEGKALRYFLTASRPSVVAT
jgi:hypothetical protein